MAEYLARRDYNVLAIGLDPQAVLARRFGFDMWGADSHLPNSARLFDHGVQPGDAAALIQPVRWDVEKYPWAARIHVIPDHEDLAEYDCPPTKGNPALRPRKALRGVAEQYDYVLLDPAPRLLGSLADAVWATSHFLLGVAAARRDEIEGLLRLMRRVEDFREEIGNPSLDMRGIVLNEYNPRSPKQRGNLEGLRATDMGDGTTLDALVWDRYLDPGSGREIPMTLPDRSFITDTFDEDLPMAAMKSVRNRVAIDDPMNLIVDRLLEVSDRVVA